MAATDLLSHSGGCGGGGLAQHDLATAAIDGVVGSVGAERTTTRAVDLPENIAGKSALEKGGRTMVIEILRHLAGQTPDMNVDDAADSNVEPE